MTRVAFLAVCVFMVAATGRAVDHEVSRLVPAAVLGSPAVGGTASRELYQGKPIRWWAARAVQARKDANARARTIRRLRSELGRSGPSWVWLAAADCVHKREGAWDANTGNGYFGGMQADMAFQRAYGWYYLVRWGTADRWPWWAQLHMAYNGWAARGWQPWPNTARRCGLL